MCRSWRFSSHVQVWINLSLDCCEVGTLTAHSDHAQGKEDAVALFRIPTTINHSPPTLWSCPGQEMRTAAEQGWGVMKLIIRYTGSKATFNYEETNDKLVRSLDHSLLWANKFNICLMIFEDDDLFYLSTNYLRFSLWRCKSPDGFSPVKVKVTFNFM